MSECVDIDTLLEVSNALGTSADMSADAAFEHLFACATCRAELRALVVTRSALTPSSAVRAGFTDDVVTAIAPRPLAPVIEPPPPSSRTGPSRLRLAAAVFAPATATIFILAQFAPSRPPTGAPSSLVLLVAAIVGSVIAVHTTRPNVERRRA